MELLALVISTEYRQYSYTDGKQFGNVQAYLGMSRSMFTGVLGHLAVTLLRQVTNGSAFFLLTLFYEKFY